MIEIFENINTNNLIDNLTGIGTFITSIIALFTLVVVKKQRKDSLRPKVIFGNGTYAICKSENNQILKTKWIDGEKEGEKDEDESIVCFELLNAGVGIAESVEITESFNLKKAINFIKDLDLDNELLFDLRKTEIVIKTTFDDTHILYLLDVGKREVGTILPIGHQKNGDYIFPEIYLYLLSCFSYLKEKHDDFYSLENFPKYFFNISFKDIEGKKYNSKYACKAFSINSTSYSLSFIKR